MSITFIADDLDLDKTVTQLMADFDADRATVGEHEGAPLIVVHSTVDGDHWFLAAEEKPEHAPGEWFECEGVMVTRVEDRHELCTCEPAWSSADGTYFPFELHDDCPVHH